MKKTLEIILILILLPFPCFAQLKVDFKQNQTVIMPDQAYVFLNHSTAEWDSKFTSLKGINAVIEFAKSNSIKTIATVHGDAFINEFGEQDRYFISNANVDYILHSDGGAHKLQFPNANILIVGGGNLHVCLCESIRDLVRGLMPLGETKHIYLVEEAVYDTDILGMPKNEAEMLRFASEFIFPNFPCPDQVSTGFGPLDLNQINLKFYYRGKLLKKLNEDKLDLPTIAIHFEKLEYVKNILVRIQ